jgi:hypothetical protein
MEPTATQLDRYIKLFRGRGDVYGSEAGSCVKQPLTREVFHNHLAGETPIGVYPMVPIKNDWYTVWGCTDIDTGDLKSTISIRDSLAAAGVHAFIEKSRSKGYHVWVFASEPVLARDMRRMLLAAHQVADYEAREINPKQESLASTAQYGNYVRLPYPNHNDLTIPNRRVITDDETPISLDAFLDDAEAHLTHPDTIARIASFYKPPVAPTAHNTDYVPCESLPDAMRPLSALGKVIWRDGPLPNNDRSRTLAKLGHECVRSGLNPSQTHIILTDADLRWGKYHLRTHGELEIDKLVLRVYQTT